ncbi:MAG: hypothetical protein OXH50_21255 [Gemmatimonadetes bacterium]|nr:hypothetical protein [Gemmatimonadota bacterium]
MVRAAEVDENRRWPAPELRGKASVNPLLARLALLRLRRRALLRQTATGLRLTELGHSEGLRLLRGHRLWETYLNELGIRPDHVHDPADILEHYIDERLEREIDRQVAERALDPQGKEIPTR